MLSPFPSTIPDREAYFLDRVRAGSYDVTWLPIASTHQGHMARFWVSGDAMKVDGVRINVSAYAQQQIADLVGASLLTPKLADLLYMEADIILPPMPRPITSSTEAMVDQSQKLDDAIMQAVGSLAAAQNRLVQTVGKHWVIDNDLLSHPGRAENYGWHFRGPSFGGLHGEATASLAKDPTSGAVLRLIQGRGWAHDMYHADYSQNCVLVLESCELDGQPSTLGAILTNADLAPLASHQGVMTVLRQPGVGAATA